jgi:pimeloyl-ACP methyl ester carboxylesterase
VLLDNRGSGRSDPPPQTVKIADMVRDVVAVLDDAGIAQTSVLGASLGGIVTQELAVLHPERVSRLVPACTTPGWPFAFPMPAASALLMGRCATSRRRRPGGGWRRTRCRRRRSGSTRNWPSG